MAHPTTEGATTGDVATTGEVATAEAATHEGPGGPAFWVAAAVGAAIVAFGIRGLAVNEPNGAPSAARWLIGGALVVDLVVVPLGAALGLVAKRLVPGWAWPVVRAGLLVSVVLAAFATPLVLEAGGDPADATLRPRDYRTGLLLALSATWAVAAAALFALRLRRPRPAAP